MADLRLMEDPDGMVFEYLDEQEAEFLYEEVFVRRSYLQHGLVVEKNAVVIDAGANIGLFSMQCLREASGVQVYAFEPIPVIYGVLARNLSNSVQSTNGIGSCLAPTTLQVALGAEKGAEEFTYIDGNPGESTRHLEEREAQQQRLREDKNAASWKKILERASDDQLQQASPKASNQKCVVEVGSCSQETADGQAMAEIATFVHAMASPAEQDCGICSRLPGAELSGSKEGAECACETTRLGSANAAAAGWKTQQDGIKNRPRKLKVDGAGKNSGSRTGEHEVEDGDRKRWHGLGSSFVCSVVPLSLALHQLRLDTVALLKVDVEGDELAVLQGIDDHDWPKIQQVAVEVHDTNGRLAATIQLLRSEPAAFDEVCWESQRTSEVNGYVMVVPEALRMFLVFAKRQRGPKVASLNVAYVAAPAASAVATGIHDTNFAAGGCDKNRDTSCTAVEDTARGGARMQGSIEQSNGSTGHTRGDEGRRDHPDIAANFCSCAVVAAGVR